MKKSIVFSAFIAAAAFALPAFASANPEVGQPAPAFTLTDSHGKPHSLADYKGKYVVLEWTNLGCPFVKAHYDSGVMQKLQKTETAKGVVWLTICSSAPGKQSNMPPADWNKALAERHAAPTALLIDADGKVGHEYDAKTTPDMFVITPDGKLIYKGAIDDKRSADKADALIAHNYVAAALNEARAGKPVAKSETPSYGCGVKYAD